MKVWIVNQYAIDPSAPGGARHYVLARELVTKGHHVTVIASTLHLHTRTNLNSAGLEEIDGVVYLRIPTSSYSTNGVARAVSMGTFALRVLTRARVREIGRPDVVIGSSPDLFTAMAARSLARRFQVPFVLEVRDLWPDTFVDLGAMSRFHPFVRLLSSIERSLYRSSQRAITLLPNLASTLEARGVAPGRVEWIPNRVDLKSIPEPISPTGDGRAFVLVYAGAHGQANGLDSLVDAAKLLAPDEEQSWSIRLIGDGLEKQRLMTRAAGVSTIRFDPPVPKTRIYDELAKADAFVLPLKRSSIFRFGISPNKLFDYMAMERPVILAVEAANDPVAEAGAGLTVPPDDPTALVGAMRTLASMPPDQRQAMGRRGRAYVMQHHDMSRLAERLEALLEGTIAEERPAPPLKRAIDVAGASMGLCLVAIPMAAIGAAIRATMGKPVLFPQERPGRGGRPFVLAKFRTMSAAQPKNGELSTDEARMTSLGRFLRRSSLDELPELWSVLKGDMSLVGPRPLLTEYLDRYTPEQLRRHSVKPGITGWAQVNGRNALTWEEKFALDLWYVDNWTIGLDLKILWMTLFKVFRREGISAEGHATMPPFTGAEGSTDT
jgi:lipopolysaccharide/colanic/teichoic acid biosynthesis glycosyltransferase